MRRLLHILSTALITAGVVVLLDVGLTIVWKEPLSTVYGSIQQGKAEDSLDALTERFLGRERVDEIDSQDPRRLARIFGREIETGQGIGRIQIPAIDLDTVIVHGTDTSTLQKGPGHYPTTSLPGQGKTIGVAGHRTTYLAPFRRINEIADGDEIVLEMPYGTFSYQVEKHEIVEPTRVEIVRDVGYERLVLTACHPLYSAAQRWAVFAELTDFTPASETPRS